jgi:hypothetical protein
MTDSPVGEIMLLHRDVTVDDYTNKYLTLTRRDADLPSQAPTTSRASRSMRSPVCVPVGASP